MAVLSFWVLFLATQSCWAAPASVTSLLTDLGWLIQNCSHCCSVVPRDGTVGMVPGWSPPFPRPRHLARRLEAATHWGHTWATATFSDGDTERSDIQYLSGPVPSSSFFTSSGHRCSHTHSEAATTQHHDTFSPQSRFNKSALNLEARRNTGGVPRSTYKRRVRQDFCLVGAQELRCQT